MYTYSKLVYALCYNSVPKCCHPGKIARRFCSSRYDSLQDMYRRRMERNKIIPEGTMGQPTCHTHPHMVAPGELAAGITPLEFMERRAEFMRRIVRQNKETWQEKGNTILIPSASKVHMTEKIPYIFRQSSDFYYLTGCLEPDCLLMMTNQPQSENIYQTILFMRGKNSESELWDGPRTSIDDAPSFFKVDVALPFSELTSYLTRHLISHKSNHVWYSAGTPRPIEGDYSVRKALTAARPNGTCCPRGVLATQRLIKSSAEVIVMMKACEVGNNAVNNAMAVTQPAISEHDILASLDYWCRRSGAEHLAFPPVIGAGPRATSIHYIHDNQLLKDDELLLVDAGCQYSMYNSDITRTWPVSGQFTDAQAVLYDIVLCVQKELMKVLDQRRPTLDTLFDFMCRTLGGLLRHEGIISRQSTDNECYTMAYKYCPHHVSHYLGLDVHDTPPIKRNLPVVPGMVITVEPGVYINPKDRNVAKEFRGIGIRIEDDVLITNGSPINLTEGCIKERAAIENIVGTKSLPQ